MHPLIQIPFGTYAVLRRVTAECCFIVPLTPQFLQLNTCSSCPSFPFDFFSSTSVYVTVPTIKSFLTPLPATHCCGYQLCFVTNRFMKLSYCFLCVWFPPASFLQKIKKESVVQFRTLYSSEHRTVQNIVQLRTSYSSEQRTVQNIVQLRTSYSSEHRTVQNIVQLRTSYSSVHRTVQNTVQLRTSYSSEHCTAQNIVQFRTSYSSEHCTVQNIVQFRTSD